MDNKGFTLIELLVSLIILGLVMTIAVSSASRFSKNVKQQNRENLIARIEAAASKYAFDTGETAIFVQDLITSGYLDVDDDDDIKDPVDNSISLKCYVVMMEREGDHYNATFLENSDTRTCNSSLLNNYRELNTDTGNIKIEVYKNGIIQRNLTNKLSGNIKFKATSSSININCSLYKCKWVTSTGKSSTSDSIDFQTSSAYREITGTFTITIGSMSYSSSVTIKT